ncbi:hypothetical protein ABKV19_020756, partial [Rosa sericea]
ISNAIISVVSSPVIFSPYQIYGSGEIVFIFQGTTIHPPLETQASVIEQNIHPPPATQSSAMEKSNPSTKLGGHKKRRLGAGGIGFKWGQ